MAVYSWAVAALVIAALALLTLLRAKALRELRRVLHEEGNAELYLRLLNNPHLRVVFSRRALAELRSEGERALRATATRASGEKGD